MEKNVKKTNCTLYIASQCVEDAKNNNILELIDGNPDFIEIENQARLKKDAFLLKQSKLKSSDIIRQLKEEKIYPYANVNSSADKIARNLYDKIIIKINEKKPNVLKSSETRQFIVSSVKVLLEKEPEHFANILQKLLSLTAEETAEFSNLLNETDLSNIIKISTLLSDRLKFLESLRYLVYGDIAKNLRERTQLHKILAKEAWIFGEEYKLIASDRTFSNTINDIRRDIPDFVGEDIIAGGKKIPDLFFAAKTYYGNQQWGIIVELKRPSVVISTEEFDQIKKYYKVIKNRPEFVNWKIDFIVISSDIDSNELEGEIDDSKTGSMKYSDKDPLKKIYVKRWADIIDKNSNSYRNLKNDLDIDLDENVGKQYLKDKFSDIIDI